MAKNAFAFSPHSVFLRDRPEGNFIACGRNKNEFFAGKMDHFRIYRKVHNDFDAVGPPPPALTQIPESSDNFHQSLKYHTTADWDYRIQGEKEGEIPTKAKKWLLRVRGY